MGAMDIDDTTETTYESPTLEVVGTLAELTKNGTLFPSDDGINANTAQPFGS